MQMHETYARREDAIHAEAVGRYIRMLIIQAGSGKSLYISDMLAFIHSKYVR